MKSLWRAVLVLMILVMALAVIAPFTESGTRRLLDLVQHYAPLEIDYLRGSLGSGLELGRLVYASGAVRVETRDLAAELRLACLWRSAICIEHLEVGSTLVQWHGGEWRQGPAQLALRVSGSSIDVRRAVVDSAVLELREDQPAPATRERFSLPVIDLPLELSVDELLLRAPRWDIYGSQAVHDELLVRGRWSGTRLEIVELRTSAAEIGSLALAGNIRFRDDWPLHAQGDVRVTHADSWEGLRQQPVTYALSGSLENLGVEATSNGRPALDLQAELAVLDPQLPFKAWLAAKGEGAFAVAEVLSLPPPLDGLALELPWRGVVNGNMQQQSFELQGAMLGAGYQRLALGLSGAHSEGVVQLDGLQLRDSDGESQLEARGEVRLGEKFSLALSLNSDGLNLPAFADPLIGRVSGELALALEIEEQNWQLVASDIDLQGEINSLPASASGMLLLDQGGSLRGSELQAAINNARLSLAAAGEEAATLSVNVSDLGTWFDGATGQLQLLASLAPETLDLEFEGSFSGFRVEDFEIEQGQLAGHYQGGRFDLSLDATTVQVGELELTQIELSATGDDSRQRLRLSTLGDIRTDLLVAGEGWGEDWRGRLSPASLETSQGPWQLQNAVPLLWRGDSRQLSIGDHCWLAQNAAVCAQDLILGTESSGQLAVDGELAMLDFLMPRGMKLQGAVKGRFRGRFTEVSGPTLTGTAEISQVNVTRYYGDGESASANWEQGFLQADYDQSGLSLQASLQREQRRVLSVELRVPREGNEAILGNVSLDRIQLGPLIAFAPGLSSLQGELSGDFELFGTLAAPQVRGKLELSRGELVLMANPTPLKQVQLALDLRGDSGKLVGKGLLGGGPVQLEGELQWLSGLRLELQVEGERQNVLYPPATEMLLSESLQIVAAPGLVQIRGSVVIHQGSLEPEVLPEGSVAVSSDIVEVDYAGNVIRQQLPFDIDMDVNVRVENRFRIRSSLAVATLGGELRLLQRAGQPLQLFGTLSLVSGEVRAYQQQLRIERGTLAFGGRPDNPSINVRAVRRISGSRVVVGMQVLGTYDNLRLEVFSEPEMSEGEKMSYLVRGRGLDSGAGEDGTALALSVASGVVNSTTLVSELNRIPGVSNVGFGAEGTADDTAATVSGYIGERIYLSYGIGVYEPINVLIARLYLRTRLWLEVVSRLENSVDLYYAFDID